MNGHPSRTPQVGIMGRWLVLQALRSLPLAGPLVACSSTQTIADASAPPSAAASVTGSVGGETLIATDCIGGVRAQTALGNPHLTLYVFITDTAGTCAKDEAGYRTKDTRVITIQIDRQFPAEAIGEPSSVVRPIPAFQPGTYAINESPDGFGFNSDSPGPEGTVEHIGVEYRRFDSQCENQVALDAGGGFLGTPAAMRGTIVLTKVTAETIEGSFDATFTDGSLKGTFVAPICSAFANPGTVPRTCP